MSTVLLGWELGGGLGHVGALLAVARRLWEHGHAPVLALKDLIEPLPILRRESFPVVQAPVWTGGSPSNFAAASYADILAIRGYADADGLEALVGGWQKLIELTRAELVVCESAPTLVLAAYGGTPALAMENGFHAPPSHLPAFPTLHAAAAPVVPAEVLLDCVREVQRRRGRRSPSTLPGLFGEAHRFVRTFPETDPYRDVRPKPADGPLCQLPGPLAPPTGRSTFYAYLAADYPGADLLFPHLAAAGHRGGVFLRNASPALLDVIRGAGIEVQETLLPLHEACTRAAVVIHHGSLGAAEAALAAGRPQLSLPRHMEHEYTGRALEDLGVGLSLTGRLSLQDVEHALSRLLTEPAFAARAMALAHEVRARLPGECLTAIVDCCLRLLAA